MQHEGKAAEQEEEEKEEKRKKEQEKKMKINKKHSLEKRLMLNGCGKEEGKPS